MLLHIAHRCYTGSLLLQMQFDAEEHERLVSRMQAEALSREARVRVEGCLRVRAQTYAQKTMPFAYLVQALLQQGILPSGRQV